MSISDGKDKRRVVVPRWRSLTNTPTIETIPTVRFPDVTPVTTSQFRDLIVSWRKSGKAPDYVDILDAGIATGNRRLASEGARWILKNSDQFAPKLLERSEGILFGKHGHVATPQIDADSKQQIFQKIGRLKVDVSDSPRNSLAHIEIARLYSRLAQFDSAEPHIVIAAAISPNDRFVLRALTRYYTMIGEPRKALRAIWKSESLASDPWVQSAELASAMIAKSATRRADRAGEALARKRNIPREFSELAAGWATRTEIRGSSTKKTIRALQPILLDPTENALAQSVWLTDHIGEDFNKSFPTVHLPRDAHEALALLYAEEGKYVQAAKETTFWMIDQPFQARSFLLGAFLRFVHLDDAKGALEVVESGLNYHEDDWALLNLGVVSAVLAKDIEKADKLLLRLNDEAKSDYAKSFVMAGKGMILFGKRDFESGLKCYIQTIKFCTKHGFNDLAVNAAMYLVENLCRYALISLNDFNEFWDELTKRIKRLAKGDIRESEQSLKSREWICRRYLKNHGADENAVGMFLPDDLNEAMSD